MFKMISCCHAGRDRRAAYLAILIGILTVFSSSSFSSSSSEGEDLAVEADQLGAGVAQETPFSVQVHPATKDHSKRPVLLIPGLGSPASVWEQTVDVLTARGHDAHVFQLAGFAGLAAQGEDLLPRVHGAIIDYARRLDAKPALIGHSLGGTLALWMASSAPDLFGPVVAVDGVAFLPALQDPSATEASSRSRAEQLRTMISGMSVADYDRQMEWTLSTMITDPAAVGRMAEASRGSDPKTIAEAIFDLMTRDLRDDLATVKSPVLLLAAGGSAPTAEGAARLRASYGAQVKAVPNHRVEVVEAARHFIMLDAPERFFHFIQEHFDAYPVH